MTNNQYINAFLNYGVKSQLIEDYDQIYIANRVIDLIGEKTFFFENIEALELPFILEGLCHIAYINQKIDSEDVTTTDLFDTRLMDLLMPKPSEVKKTFEAYYKENPQKATNYYYDLAIKSNYIRMERIKKNICFKAPSQYGTLDITINLSKPEKDPKLIAMAKSIPSSGYPKCLLCYENMGYAGNLNHPARENHRIIPLVLDNDDYFMQYSPYVYYNEHTIVFNKEHTPMVINEETFTKLLDFVSQFKHYFLGSNADLPIVGGSILTHDHFQGGGYVFPMFEASVRKDYGKIDNVQVAYINWPLDTIRLTASNKEDIVSIASKLLMHWRGYQKETIELFAYTENTPHNTITPIARYNGKEYELYLVLRNNRTTERYPFGLFHPDVALHHIKKENIGLIEVMGLAVLPKRLKEEMEGLKKVFLKEASLDELTKEPLLKHAEWAKALMEKYQFTKENINAIMKKELAFAFEEVLESCSVFKFGEKNQEMDDFLSSL